MVPMTKEKREAVLALHPEEDRDEIQSALDEYESLQSEALRRDPEALSLLEADESRNRLEELRRRIYGSSEE